jgi:hypothetical protein
VEKDYRHDIEELKSELKCKTIKERNPLSRSSERQKLLQRKKSRKKSHKNRKKEVSQQ